MTKTIHKHHLPVQDGDVPLVLPEGARLLRVDNQHEEVTLWFEVDPARTGRTHLFRVLGTGHAVPANADYRGSALVAGGRLVWHVYEMCEPPPVELR